MSDEIKVGLQVVLLILGLLLGILIFALGIELIIAHIDLWKMSEQLRILNEAGLDKDLVKEIAKLIGGN